MWSCHVVTYLCRDAHGGGHVVEARLAVGVGDAAAIKHEDAQSAGRSHHRSLCGLGWPWIHDLVTADCAYRWIEL